MGRLARLLTAEGEEAVAAKTLQARCGYSSVEQVYRMMRAGREMLGKRWRWLTDGEMKTHHHNAEREANPNHSKHPTIVCGCTVCSGRHWTIGEIKSLPVMVRGKSINETPISKPNLPFINEATGHQFAYVEEPAVGEWADNGGDRSNLPSHKARQLPAPSLPAPRKFDPDNEYRGGPINPYGPGSSYTTSFGVPRR